MKNKNSLLFCSLFFYACTVWATSLPEQLIVPGGIVKMGVGDFNQPAPKVFFNKNRVLVTHDGKHWVALVGIPLSAEVGGHEITIQAGKSSRQQGFTLVAKNYPEQRLTIKKKRMVTGFTKADLKELGYTPAEIKEEMKKL